MDNDINIMNEPDITCTACGNNVHWLEVFPGQICLDCHARKVDSMTPQQLHDTVINGFTNPLK
jgi:hypothetical protein